MQEPLDSLHASSWRVRCSECGSPNKHSPVVFIQFWSRNSCQFIKRETSINKAHRFIASPIKEDRSRFEWLIKNIKKIKFCQIGMDFIHWLSLIQLKSIAFLRSFSFVYFSTLCLPLGKLIIINLSRNLIFGIFRMLTNAKQWEIN